MKIRPFLMVFLGAGFQLGAAQAQTQGLGNFIEYETLENVETLPDPLNSLIFRSDIYYTDAFGKLRFLTWTERKPNIDALWSTIGSRANLSNIDQDRITFQIRNQRLVISIPLKMLPDQ